MNAIRSQTNRLLGYLCVNWSRTDDRERMKQENGGIIQSRDKTMDGGGERCSPDTAGYAHARTGLLIH